MIAVATYIEEVKPGWRNFDKFILMNLQYVFSYDVHYYIAQNERDRTWFYRQNFLGEHRLVVTAAEIKSRSGSMHYVNVQPPNVFHRQEVVELHEFKHPDNCCYIFGPNHGVIETVGGLNVLIPLDKSSLYASSAVAMVLYDRKAKRG